MKTATNRFLILFIGVLALFASFDPLDIVSAQGKASPSPSYQPGEASEVVRHLIQTPGDAPSYKQYLFNGVKRNAVRKLASTATTKPDQFLFMMLYDTHTVVPDNLTDDGLAAAVSDPKSFKKQAAKPCKRATGSEIRALESFPAAEAAALYEAISAPSFSVGQKPFGASGTTWASQSLWQAQQVAGKVELARKSVVLKLLASQGIIQIPNSMNIVFAWSRRPSITMELDPISWSKADVPGLRRLLGNPYYGEAAQNQLNLLVQR